MGLLDGKKALVTGVANKRSIAWGIATALQREGADLAFNYAIDRLKENVDELVATLPGHEKIDATFSELEKRWGSLDILIHCIAFAPLEELKGSFTSVSRNGMLSAIDISAYSLIALTRGALPLFEKAGGGAVMSLTFNAAERVVPSYNAMAIAKAALEAETRYLAAELGAKNVREETGLQVTAERLSGVYFERATLCHHFVFVCRASTAGEARPSSPEITDVRWCQRDALPRPISDFTVRRIEDAVGGAAARLQEIAPRTWLR